MALSDRSIYLDYNATTPVLSEVLDAMLPFLREHFGNPSSGHVFGRRAREAVEQARGQVAALLDCGSDEVVFTSGGSEANNLAIRGVAEARPDRRHVVTSAIEHPAVTGPCGWLEARGWRITRVGVDTDGRACLDQLLRALGDDTALVTLMHANNETGVLQPVAEAVLAAHRNGALVHTDAAQSVGKLPVSVRDLGVDLLSVAGHKLYGPKGVGALYVRRGTPLVPFALGAGHERGLRPGTENVPCIVGLGVACQRARRDLGAEATRVALLRDRLWERLRAEIPDVQLNGHPTERLPNTLSVRFPRVSGTTLLGSAPDVAASTGSACHDGAERPPAVVVAMGVAEREALGTVRLTLGRETSVADVDQAASSLSRAWRALATSVSSASGCA